jgi:hypothetical protein
MTTCIFPFLAGLLAQPAVPAQPRGVLVPDLQARDAGCGGEEQISGTCQLLMESALGALFLALRGT